MKNKLQFKKDYFQLENMDAIALIGKKLGMMSFWSENKMIPVTVVEILPNALLKTSYIENKKQKQKSVSFLVSGGNLVKESKVNKPQRNLFKSVNSEYMSDVKEFRFNIESEITIPSETKFLVGDYLKNIKLDVRGISRGKGFQGAMKRWGFGGMPASHGVSVTHRHIGSTGQRSLAGKVWKNKKMSGHMGSEKVCVKNLSVVEVYQDKNLILISGSVPGSENSMLYITNAKNFRHSNKVLSLNGVSVS